MIHRDGRLQSNGNDAKYVPRKDLDLKVPKRLRGRRTLSLEPCIYRWRTHVCTCVRACHAQWKCCIWWLRTPPVTSSSQLSWCATPAQSPRGISKPRRLREVSALVPFTSDGVLGPDTTRRAAISERQGLPLCTSALVVRLHRSRATVTPK